MSDPGNRSATDLLGDLIGQISTLFRKEVQLARAEVGEKVSQVSASAVSIAIGGVLLLAALIILLQAVVAFLVQLGLSPALASLLVAAAVGIGGYLMLRGGLNSLKASNLMPQRTVEQLSRDAAVARETVR